MERGAQVWPNPLGSYVEPNGSHLRVFIRPREHSQNYCPLGIVGYFRVDFVLARRWSDAPRYAIVSLAERQKMLLFASPSLVVLLQFGAWCGWCPKSRYWHLGV